MKSNEHHGGTRANTETPRPAAASPVSIGPTQRPQPLRRSGWFVLSPILVAFGLALLGARHAEAAAPPRLVSSSPANGATGVAVTSVVTLTFDVPMLPNPALSGDPGFGVGGIAWSANVPGAFSYEWSEDYLMVTCTYADDLPPNTTITWTLNPAGVSPAFQLQSLEFVALPIGVHSGSFTTGAAGGGGGGGGGGGDEAPELVSVTPPDGATGVPVGTSVLFVFDRPMQKLPVLDPAPGLVQGAILWTGSGVQRSLFTYSWNEDGTILTANYGGDLPGETLITWALNPDGADIQLESEDGEPLPSETYSGSFTTGEGGGNPGGGGDDCNPDAIPEDWGSYSINKSSSHHQSSDADPTPIAEDPFDFGSFVFGPDAGPGVTSASLTLPGGSRTNLTSVPFGGGWFLMGAYPTEAALEGDYPAGNYNLRFQRTGEAERSFPIPMPALATIPVPKVLNFTEAQSINPAADFTLRFNGFAGATEPNDFINLIITSSTGVVFQAPDFCIPRDLPITATSVVIPAGTLSAGGSYQFTLSYSRSVYFSTNAVPSMAGYASLGRTLDCPLQAAGGGGGTADPARFIAYRVLPNGNPEMTLTGTAGRSYIIQQSRTLLPGSWAAARTVTMDAAGRATFEDTGNGSARPVFYRAVSN